MLKNYQLCDYLTVVNFGDFRLVLGTPAEIDISVIALNQILRKSSEGEQACFCVIDADAEALVSVVDILQNYPLRISSAADLLRR